MRAMGALVGLVSRAPARLEVKLLTAFLASAVLLIVMGVVSLQVLRGVNQRNDELISCNARSRPIAKFSTIQRANSTASRRRCLPPTRPRCRPRYAN